MAELRNMTAERSPRKASWVVAGSADALAALAPLMIARKKTQRVVELIGGVEALLANPAQMLPRGSEGVLVVGPRQVSPRRGLQGLFLIDAQRRRVPVGWLPDVGADLTTYARAAARVLDRVPRGEVKQPKEGSTWGRGALVAVCEPNAATAPRPHQAGTVACGGGAGGPVVVLGQWEDRFLRVGLRTSRWFERHPSIWPAVHWTADRISRENMLRGLADCGPALAMYFGHGRPRGWAGYHGVRREHFASPWAEPMGALLALCCENASRWRTAISFTETLALRGVFAGALAAVTKTRHEHNRRLGPAICEVLTTLPIRTLADLVLALPEEEWMDTPYRFIGDPAAPLIGAENAVVRAARVFAPAPDEILPPWEEISA